MYMGASWLEMVQLCWPMLTMLLQQLEQLLCRVICQHGLLQAYVLLMLLR
jgi:hypothetical protein